MIKKILKNKKGFGLLEIAVSISVVTISIIPLVNLLSSSLRAGRIVEERLTAVYLAQEGAEIIRKIRDDGWADLLDGNMAIVSKETNCNLVDIIDGFKLVSTSSFANSKQVLSKNNNGYVQCQTPGGSWKDTGFTRVIDISHVDYAGNADSNYAKIAVTVSKGGTVLYSLTSYLNNLD